MTLIITELAFGSGTCFFLTKFLKKDGEQMTGAENSLTLYLPNRPLPEDSNFSIPVMERRLISMLEELDRDIKCSRAMRPPIDGRLAERAVPGERRKNAHQAILRLKDACAAETRAVAFIVAVSGVVGLFMGLASWSRAPNLFETISSNTETEIAKARAQTATGADVGIEGASAIKEWAQSSSLAPFDDVVDDALRPRGEQAVGGSDGLSIDEFNAQVRRLFGQRQAAAEDRAALFESWPGGVFASKDDPRPAADEPLPITPPAAVAPAASKLEIETADLATKPLDLASFNSSRRNEHSSVVSGGKGSAPAASAKIGSHKRTNNRTKAQARQPTPAPADNGPLAFIQGAADALTSVVKDWGQIASTSREDEKSPNPTNR